MSECYRAQYTRNAEPVLRDEYSIDSWKDNWDIYHSRDVFVGKGARNTQRNCVNGRTTTTIIIRTRRCSYGGVLYRNASNCGWYAKICVPHDYNARWTS